MAKRRKKNPWRTLLVSLTVVSCLAIIAFYLSRYFTRPSFVHYDAFGISLPSNYAIHGIDVSRHQRNISWDAVKMMKVKNVKIGFAFIKATEGLGRIDEQFRRNWHHAGKEKIPRGAYHFFIASKSGKAQAENFIETVKLEKGDLPPVLDVEQTNGASTADLQRSVGDWLKAVEKAYGVRPIIYTNADFYTNFLAGQFDDYPLWVAHYLVKDKPRINRKWHFWQHSESGHVSGIEPYVDFNVFNGDSSSFRRMLMR